MAKSNTGKYVILGAVALGAVYLITRRSSGYQPPPSPVIAQQQLQQWAQTQSNPSVLQSVINNLSIDDLIDLWDRIFNKDDTSMDYSGGGYSSDWDTWV